MLRNFLLVLFGLYLGGTTTFAQRIVDQTSIDPESTINLVDPMTLEAFANVLTMGQLFPDFQTVSTEDEVIDLALIYQRSISTSRVPVIVFGRSSCPIMRGIYTQLVIPADLDYGQDFSIYHLANSIEAHATNGYTTPYYEMSNGNASPAPQIPMENGSHEFLQPFTGAELVSMTQEFTSKMELIESVVMPDLTVLLDSPEGGFTEAFGGPALVWVVNPLTGMVLFEDNGLTCLWDPTNTACTERRQELRDAIQNVQDQMAATVGIDNLVPSLETPVDLGPINLLGQETHSGQRLFYFPATKEKVIRLAQ